MKDMTIPVGSFNITNLFHHAKIDSRYNIIDGYPNLVSVDLIMNDKLQHMKLPETAKFVPAHERFNDNEAKLKSKITVIDRHGKPAGCDIYATIKRSDGKLYLVVNYYGRDCSSISFDIKKFTINNLRFKKRE